MRTKTASLPFLVLGALLGSSLAQNTPSTPSSAPAPSSTPSTPVAIPATLPAGWTAVPFLSQTPVRTFKSAPQMQLEKGKNYAAVMDTSKGRIVLDLFEADTPVTVNSFVFLARNRFYEGTAFHRVLKDFVVQGGDPNTLKSDRTTWGAGGPGYQFGLELRKKLNFDAKGVLGMARTADPNSNSGGFYITLAPVSNLNGAYTVFGKVLEGLDVLDKITKINPEDPASKDITPDKILRVTIVTKNK